MTDDPRRPADAWFAPRRYGYGAGLPIAWQGWVLLAIFLALIVLAGAVHWPWRALVVLPGAVVLDTMRRTTQGGWRWRWGRD